MTTYTDTELLNFLQLLTNQKTYTGRVILRMSTTDRGWRLHETSQHGAVEDVRTAIDRVIRETVIGQKADKADLGKMPRRTSLKQIESTKATKSFLEEHGYKWKKTWSTSSDDDISFYDILTPEKYPTIFGRFRWKRKVIGELYTSDRMDHARLKVYDATHEPYLYELLKKLVLIYPMDSPYTELVNK